MDIKNIMGRGISPYLQNAASSDATNADAALKAKTVQTQAANAGTDTVNISEGAKLQSLAMREAQGSPEVRTDKVEDLKARIKDGSYKPDSRAIAEGIVRSEAGFVTSGASGN